MQNKKEEILLIFLYGQILPDFSAGNAMQNTTVDGSGMFGNINCEKR